MATIVGTFTNPLKNGTTEDATQVMNLFSFIQSQVNSNACPATTGQSILKGDGSGGTAAAAAGTDYAPPLFTGAYSANLSGSRAIGQSYTNNTGKPLFVSVSVKGSVNNSTVDVSWSVGSVTSIGRTNLVAGNPASYTELTTSIIVPPGASYLLNATQATIDSWFEMS